MKLKKIASLMLAGVMAVSMLAGCSGDGNKEENGGNTEVKPTVSNAVTVMNDAQSAVKFEANPDFDAALAAAAKKAAHEEVSKAGYTVKAVVNGNVSDELTKKLDVNAGLVTSEGEDIYFNGKNESAQKGGTSATLTGLWIVEANGLTEKAALEQVAKTMKGNYVNGDKTESPKYPETVTLDDGDHAATYTGNVSIVTVNTSDEGETATAYYIAVSVTQTLARDAQSNVNASKNA